MPEVERTKEVFVRNKSHCCRSGSKRIFSPPHDLADAPCTSCLLHLARYFHPPPYAWDNRTRPQCRWGVRDYLITFHCIGSRAGFQCLSTRELPTSSKDKLKFEQFISTERPDRLFMYLSSTGCNVFLLMQPLYLHIFLLYITNSSLPARR